MFRLISLLFLNSTPIFAGVQSGMPKLTNWLSENRWNEEIAELKGHEVVKGGIMEALGDIELANIAHKIGNVTLRVAERFALIYEKQKEEKPNPKSLIQSVVDDIPGAKLEESKQKLLLVLMVFKYGRSALLTSLPPEKRKEIFGELSDKLQDVDNCVTLEEVDYVLQYFPQASKYDLTILSGGHCGKLSDDDKREIMKIYSQVFALSEEWKGTLMSRFETGRVFQRILNPDTTAEVPGSE